MNDFERRTEALKLALLLPPHRDDAIAVLDMLTALTHAFMWQPVAEAQHQPAPPSRVRVVTSSTGGKS